MPTATPSRARVHPDHVADDEYLALVGRIQAGDRTAEDDLARRLGRRVFVILLARVRDADAARELAQDVLMAVLDAVRRGQVREPELLAAFVRGVARNLANNHLRARSREPVRVELTPEMVWADAEEEAAADDRQRRICQALARLDPLDRQILQQSIVEGRTALEVARELGMSAEAIRARKSRALKRIAKGLQRQMSRFAHWVPRRERGTPARGGGTS
jgi:RNA polymerase sigma factor (sigma-70 family)